MSDKQKPEPAQKDDADTGIDTGANTGTNNGTDTVIEAEIIEGPSEKPVDPPKTTVREAEQPAAKKGGRAGWYLSALLIAFIGGVFAAPYGEAGLQKLGLIAPPQAPAVQDTQDIDLSAIENRLTLLEETLAAQSASAETAQALVEELKASVQNTQDDVALLAAKQLPVEAGGDNAQALKTEVDRLGEEVARLSLLKAEENPDLAKLTGTIALLRAELDQVKAGTEQIKATVDAVKDGALEQSPRGRLVLSLGNLRDKALSGEDYKTGLAALRPDFAALPALDQQGIGSTLTYLETQAAILPYAELVKAFDDAAKAVTQATEKAEGSFLTSLFTVRSRGENATGTDAVLLQTEKRLLVRDVAGAIEAMAPLSAEGREAAKVWLGEAERHHRVLSAFDRLLLTVSKTGG